MKSIIVAIVTCLALFAASATASWYINLNPATEEPEQEETATPDWPDEPPIDTESKSPKVDAMPVMRQPNQGSTIEAVLDMSREMKKTADKQKAREIWLKKEEARVGLLHEDLEREKSEVKSFSDGVSQKLGALDTKIVEFRDLLTEMEAKKAELVELQKGTEDDPESKKEKFDGTVKELTKWFKGMQPELAASVLKSLADQGKVDLATGLLQKLDIREKGKIISALNDDALMLQLIEAIRVKPAAEEN